MPESKRVWGVPKAPWQRIISLWQRICLPFIVSTPEALFLFNKIDLYRERYFDALLTDEEKAEIESGLQAKLKEQFVHDNFFISAINKENIEDVKAYLTEKITELYQIRLPYQTKQW